MDSLTTILNTDFLGKATWIWLLFIGKFPPVISLTVTFGLIAGGVLFSLWKTRALPAESQTG